MVLEQLKNIEGMIQAYETDKAVVALRMLASQYSLEEVVSDYADSEQVNGTVKRELSRGDEAWKAVLKVTLRGVTDTTKEWYYQDGYANYNDVDQECLTSTLDTLRDLIAEIEKDRVVCSLCDSELAEDEVRTCLECSCVICESCVVENDGDFCSEECVSDSQDKRRKTSNCTTCSLYSDGECPLDECSMPY